MQYKEIFIVVKNRKKNFAMFLIFAQNIDWWYILEPPRRVGISFMFIPNFVKLLSGQKIKGHLSAMLNEHILVVL